MSTHAPTYSASTETNKHAYTYLLIINRIKTHKLSCSLENDFLEVTENKKQSFLKQPKIFAYILKFLRLKNKNKMWYADNITGKTETK